MLLVACIIEWLIYAINRPGRAALRITIYPVGYSKLINRLLIIILCSVDVRVCKYIIWMSVCCVNFHFYILLVWTNWQDDGFIIIFIIKNITTRIDYLNIKYSQNLINLNTYKKKLKNQKELYSYKLVRCKFVRILLI